MYKKVDRDIWELKNTKAQKDAKRIAIVAALHGHEKAGMSALDYCKQNVSALNEALDSVVLMLGNPDAVKAHKRALEFDLNRIWNEKENHNKNTIEYKRYLELKKHLFQPNTVMLDIHTTTSIHEPFFLIDQPVRKEIHEIVSHTPVPFITYNWWQFIGEKTISGGLHVYDPESIALGFEAGQDDAESSKQVAVDVTKSIIEYYNSPEKRTLNKKQKWLKVIEQISFPEVRWEWKEDKIGPFSFEEGEILGYADGIAYHAPFDGWLVMPNYKFSKHNPDIGFLAIEETPIVED